MRLTDHRWLIGVNLLGVWTMAALGLLVRIVGYRNSAAALADDRGFTPVDQWLTYTDVLTLWSSRSLDTHAFPYVHGSNPDPLTLPAGTVEYPSALGIHIWVTALPANTYLQFLVITTLIAAVAASIIAALLVDLVGRVSLAWSWSPLLLIYLPYNWDVLPALATVLALWLLFRGPTKWSLRKTALVAAVILGIGAAMKIYPGLLLLPVGLWVLTVDESVTRAKIRHVVEVLAAGVGTVLVFNVPFWLIDPAGWRTPFAFQSHRPIGTDTLSIWSWWVAPLIRPSGYTDAQTTTLTLVITLLSLALAGWAALTGWRRRRRNDGVYPVLAASAAMIAGYMAVNKVVSPQYALWLLPLVLLVALPKWLPWAYSIANVALFSWFFLMRGDPWTDLGFRGMALLVTINIGLLAIIYLASLSEGIPSKVSRNR